MASKEISWAIEAHHRSSLPPFWDKPGTWLIPNNEAMQRYHDVNPYAYLSFGTDKANETVLTHRIPDVVISPEDLTPGKHTFRGTSDYPIYVVKVEQSPCVSVTCGLYSAHVVGSFLAGSNSFWVLDDVLAPLPSATEWMPPPSLPHGLADAADYSLAIEAFKRTGLDPSSLEATCFVPNTGAIAKYAAVDPTALESLSSPAGVSSIKAHIIAGPAKGPADFPDGYSTFTSLAGTQIIVQKSGMHMSVRSNAMGLCAAVTGGVQHGRLQLYAISSILAPVTPDPASLPFPAGIF